MERSHRIFTKSREQARQEVDKMLKERDK